MPEIPTLKEFPYKTDKGCDSCHPDDNGDKVKLNCFAEINRTGSNVQRQLKCPACDTISTDLFDERSGAIFDKVIEKKRMFPTAPGSR